jgi:hypothetical protein
MGPSRQNLQRMEIESLRIIFDLSTLFGRDNLIAWDYERTHQVQAILDFFATMDIDNEYFRRDIYMRCYEAFLDKGDKFQKFISNLETNADHAHIMKYMEYHDMKKEKYMFFLTMPPERTYILFLCLPIIIKRIKNQTTNLSEQRGIQPKLRDFLHHC